jgi:EmrB/QacA subfamily drug resistance transporter
MENEDSAEDVKNSEEPSSKPLTRTELTGLLITVSLASFITPLIATGVNIALPLISHDFSIAAAHVGWVQTSFLLMYALFLFPFGKLSDRIGKRSIFLTGLLCQIAGFFVASVSSSLTTLLIGMALAGFGSAQVLSVSVPLLTTNYPFKERGKVIGINTAAVYVAAALGPFIGGMLAAYFGWHSLFQIMLPACLLALCIAWFVLPKTSSGNDAQKAPFDVFGAFLYIVAAFLVIMGIINIAEGAYAVVILLIGIIVSALCLWWEMKHPDPVFPVNLFRESKIFRNSSLAALINYGSTYAVALLLSFYLQHVKDFSSAVAGTILITQPIVMAILTPLFGKLSDRIDPRILATLGMAIIAASLFVLSLLTSSTPISMIILILIILGCGFSVFASPNMNSIMSSVPDRHAGSASATAGTMRVFGQLISMAVVTIAFSSMLGSVVISKEIADQLLNVQSIVFVALGLFCTIGIWFSYARGKSSQREE